MFAAFVLFLVAAGQSAAPPHSADTATHLYGSCKAFVKALDGDRDLRPEDVYSGDYCLGDIHGVSAGMDPTKRYFCIKGATFGTVARVYVSYLDQHPKLMDDPESLGFLTAMQTSYPCAASQLP
jgi:hypothetical protein